MELRSFIRSNRPYHLRERAMHLQARLTGWGEIVPLANRLLAPRWRAADNWRAYVCADQRIRKEP